MATTDHRLLMQGRVPNLQGLANQYIQMENRRDRKALADENRMRRQQQDELAQEERKRQRQYQDRTRKTAQFNENRKLTSEMARAVQSLPPEQRQFGFERMKQTMQQRGIEIPQEWEETETETWQTYGGADIEQEQVETGNMIGRDAQHPTVSAQLDYMAQTGMPRPGQQLTFEQRQQLQNEKYDLMGDVAGKKHDDRMLSKKTAFGRKLDYLKKKHKMERTGQFSVGQKAIDKAFGEEYAEFFAKGKIGDTRKSMNQLKDVQRQLSGYTDPKTGEWVEGIQATGPLIGIFPKWSRDIINPKGADAQESVEEIVQRNLKLILGAQFAQREGEQLIERAYNPRQKEEVNAQRIGRLLEQMQIALDAKIKAGRYFTKHKTLDGFDIESLVTSIDDFDLESERPPKIGTIQNWNGIEYIFRGGDQYNKSNWKRNR